MSNIRFSGLAARSSTTTVNAALTLISAAGGSFVISPNTLVVGTTFEIICLFEFIRGATATTCAVEVDALINGVVKGTTGSISTNTGASTNYGDITIYFTCYSTGVSGTALFHGRMVDNIRGGTNLGYDILGCPSGAATTPFTIDTTIQNTLDVTIEMSPAITGCQLIVTHGMINKIF